MSTLPLVPAGAPSTVTTRSLTLRPLTLDDLADAEVQNWHLDPGGYALMHEDAYPDRDAFLTAARPWAKSWAQDGLSFWLATQTSTGRSVGVGGLRRLEWSGGSYLNLYYRLAPQAQRRGWGRELAMAAVAHGREWCPQLPIAARVAPQNTPSLRVAGAAGMRAVGQLALSESDRALTTDQVPVLWRPPQRVLGTGPDGLDTGRIAELTDLWSRVNAAGGAVDFEGATTHAEVEARLRPLLEQERAGAITVLRLYEPLAHDAETLAALDARPEAADPPSGAALLGWGLVRHGSGPIAHRVNVEKLMVDPDQQGRGLGRVLLSDLHAVARRRGAQLATLGYRSGMGLGRFYAGAGYLETGRVRDGLRFSFGPRDDVQMVYRLDGSVGGSGAG